MRLSLANRLHLALGTAAVIVAALSLFLLSSLSRVDAQYRATLDGPVRTQALARKMQVVFKTQVQEWKNVLLRGSIVQDRNRYEAAFLADRDTVLAYVDSLEVRVEDAQTRSAVAAFRASYIALDSAYGSALKFFRSADGRNPFAVDSQVRGRDREPTELIDVIVERLEAEVASVVTREHRLMGQRRVLAITAVVLLLIVLGLMPALLNRVVITPLTRLQQAAARVAGGDLTTDVHHSSTDEIGDLATSFQAMTVALRDVLSDLRQGATCVSSTATALAHSTDEVHHGMRSVTHAAAAIAAAASRQAETVSESLDATRVVADRSQSISSESRAAGAATQVVTARTDDGRSASSVAESRLTDVLLAVESTGPAIESLSERTRGIQTFTDVVAGIATQSKLLAINAAIEAARSGAQGRGFGVVAQEVGKLAQESQDALDSIRKLAVGIESTGQALGERIGQVRHAMSESVAAFQQLGITLAAINDEAERSAAAVVRIGHATEEQSARSSALALAMESMAASTEENAATAQELSANNEEQAAALERIATATGSLKDLAREFAGGLDRFRLPV